MIETVYLYSILIQCTYTVYLYSVLIQCTYTVYLYSILIQYTHSNDIRYAPGILMGKLII